MKMASQRMAWSVAGALLVANVAWRLSAPDSPVSIDAFPRPQSLQERAWLLHQDPHCRTNDTPRFPPELAAERYLDDLRARGTQEEAVPIADKVWSIGNDRGFPVVYIPCRGVFRVLPSLWTELHSQGAGALP